MSSPKTKPTVMADCSIIFMPTNSPKTPTNWVDLSQNNDSAYCMPFMQRLWVVVVEVMHVSLPSCGAGWGQIVYGIFLPVLLMTNVAKTCVSQPVASLLPIPFFAVIQIAIGLFMSRFTMRLLHVDGNTEEGRETKVRGVSCEAWGLRWIRSI